MSHRGILFIISGPSGTGKTTLCRMIEHRLQIPHVISYTTRPPRKNEIEGKDYHFINDEEFNRMKQEGAFLEFASVHGYQYGTPSKMVEEAQKSGKDLILDLDTEGALTIQSKKPESILIFLDIVDETLAERLGKRGTEQDDKMKKRLEQAKFERQFKSRYNYQIQNENLEQTYHDIMQIIQNVKK